MRLSKRELKRMNNISGFCEFDYEAEIATVRMHYRSADEIIENTFGKTPVISSEALDEFEKVLNYIPQQFDVKVSLSIDDYNGYERHVITDAYNDAVNVLRFKDKETNKNRGALMLLFAVIGIVFLVGSKIFDKYVGIGIRLDEKLICFICVVLSELIFEVYFEESFTFFMIGKTYRRVTRKNRERFKGIHLEV